MTNTESKRFQIDRTDLRRWGKNLAIFAVPVALIYLVSVQRNLQDGLAFTDFIPSAEVTGMMILYVVNALIDIGRKFVADNTSQPSAV